MNPFIQNLANELGITQSVNGSWIQAIAQHYGITQRINESWEWPIAQYLGANGLINQTVMQTIAINSGATGVVNENWVQAIIPSPAIPIVNDFKNRVIGDAGYFDAEECLDSTIKTLITQGVYDKASLIVTPNSYKTSKIYSIKPTNGSGDLTFSRASARTRRNSSGVIESIANNVPALNYPAGGGCPAWSFEPQRSNVYSRSNDFSGMPDFWFDFSGASPTANQGISPDGTNNAWLFPSNTNITTQYGNNIALTSGNQLTHSIFVKRGTSTTITLRIQQTSDNVYIATTVFNLNTMTVTSGIGVVEDYGNGWFRLQITGTTLANNTYPRGFVTGLNGTVLMFGFQLEAGAFATSYMSTTGSIVTRINDIASLVRNVPTEATIYADTYLQAGSLSDGNVYSIFDLRVTGTQRVSLYRFNNQIHADIVNSTIQFSGSIYNIPTLVQGQRYRIAVRLTATQMVVFINGAIVYTSATLSMPNLSSGNTIYHGNLAGNTSVWGGLLGPLYIADSALTNEECISLTTN